MSRSTLIAKSKRRRLVQYHILAPSLDLLQMTMALERKVP